MNFNNVMPNKKTWDFLDTIQCIHLSHRKDREVHINALKHNLQIPLKIFYAEKSKFGAIRGCFESHQTIMKNALHNGCNNALIFEDDAIISKHFSFEKIQRVKHVIENLNVHWDIIYLGCFPDVWKYPQYYNCKLGFYEVKATQTHAYIVNKPYMQFFSKLNFQNKPIDEVFLETSKSFAILPTLFHQSLTYSDVSSIPISDLPFKNFITDIVEHYAMYCGKIPFSHACTFTFLVISILFFLRCKKNIYKKIKVI
jgi:hypothetical protein